jgi:hypothetical protein
LGCIVDRQVLLEAAVEQKSRRKTKAKHSSRKRER